MFIKSFITSKSKLYLSLTSKKNIKRPGTLFFINLALSDMLKATFNLPLTVASSYAQKWLFGQIGKLERFDNM